MSRRVHDLTHVLAGYETTPEGETQVGAFTSGYKRVNPLYALLVPVLVFGTGVNLTPSPQPHITGILAEPGLAELFILAHERGSRVNRDLSDDRDFWPPMPLARCASSSMPVNRRPLRRGRSGGYGMHNAAIGSQRWSRLFGQLPGRNKLKAGSRLLV